MSHHDDIAADARLEAAQWARDNDPNNPANQPTPTCAECGASIEPGSLHLCRDYLDPDTDTPMVCTDCGRAAYYDYRDEAHHHAERPADGCFLIAAEPDRAEDREHPLLKDHADARALIAEVQKENPRRPNA